METWLSVVLIILFVIIFAVAIFVAFKFKMIKYKILKNVATNTGSKGGIMPEDLGDMILSNRKRSIQ